MHVLHSLLQDGVPPGLADDQIGPLDDHDAGEEGGVAGELYDLSAVVCLVEGTFEKKKIRWANSFSPRQTQG